MRVALPRAVCQAFAIAPGQLGAALISFADPGGQCSEAGRGKRGLTEPGLYTATVSSSAGCERESLKVGVG